MHEPECEIEYDVVCVVKARGEAEVCNVCGVRDCDQSAPYVEKWAPTRTAWKGSGAGVQVEESHDRHVQRV